MKQINNFLSENIIFDICNINEGKKKNDKLSSLKNELDDLTQKLEDVREKEGEKLRNKINPIFDKYWDIINDICQKYGGSKESSRLMVNKTPVNEKTYSIHFNVGCFYDSKTENAVKKFAEEVKEQLKNNKIDKFDVDIFDNGWVDIYIEDSSVRKAYKEYDEIEHKVFLDRYNKLNEYDKEFEKSEEFNKLFRRVTKEIKQALNSDNAQDYFNIDDIDKTEYMNYMLLPNIQELYKAINKKQIVLKGKYWFLIEDPIDFEDIEDEEEQVTADIIIPGDYNPTSADMSYNQCQSAFKDYPNLANKIIQRIKDINQ